MNKKVSTNLGFAYHTSTQVVDFFCRHLFSVEEHLLCKYKPYGRDRRQPLACRVDCLSRMCERTSAVVTVSASRLQNKQHIHGQLEFFLTIVVQAYTQPRWVCGVSQNILLDASSLRSTAWLWWISSCPLREKRWVQISSFRGLIERNAVTE